MDYKYIEQLLERYWQCQTTIEEEQILRAFFSQRDIPEKLRRYQPLFAASAQMANDEVLGDDFDARILAMTEERQTVVAARTITMRRRLMPLFKAAAVVAIIITLGNAAQLSFDGKPETASEEINYKGYKDTFSDPSMAYDRVHNALELVSEGISQAEAADSTAAGDVKEDSTVTNE